MKGKFSFFVVIIRDHFQAFARLLDQILFWVIIWSCISWFHCWIFCVWWILKKKKNFAIATKISYCGVLLRSCKFVCLFVFVVSSGNLTCWFGASKMYLLQFLQPFFFLLNSIILIITHHLFVPNLFWSIMLSRMSLEKLLFHHLLKLSWDSSF